MVKRSILLAVILMFVSASIVYAGGSSSSTKCKTKYPIVLSHGMGAQYKIAGGLALYWNDIPDELKENGARVYITSVNSLDSTANKAAAWKKQVLEILAVSGAQKINLIGHSHGTIYSRYAISNLGMAPYIASHTSIAGPHRGSIIAKLVVDVLGGKDNLAYDVLEFLVSLLMGDKSPNAVANMLNLTPDFMKNVFNPATPNKSGIYYQSWAYKILTPVGAGLFLATWPIQKYYEGDNDGLVAVDSAKWGTFRGVITGSWWAGVNHLAAVDMLWGITPGFNAPAHFVDIVGDLKNKGY
ncbi:MAG TPA: alpha/beta hydrolase [Spirochaetota bacterium]|nr:alpha/beta hydrolase [Spirochaetota bacterium]HOS41726.1 alpha/beta hydrolase [Spirochaetota bacterium]HPU87041.1 alpha/beta hydrolase [Spirochaetota bacterium]